MRFCVGRGIFLVVERNAACAAGRLFRIDAVMSGSTEQPGLGRLGEIFRVFLRLGLTSFEGVVAHPGYSREAFVVRPEA